MNRSRLASLLTRESQHHWARDERRQRGWAPGGHGTSPLTPFIRPFTQQTPTDQLPKTRRRKLLGLGLPEWAACEGAYSRKAYWRMANSGVVKRALTKERLIHWGFYDLASAYQSLHVNY